MAMEFSTNAVSTPRRLEARSRAERHLAHVALALYFGTCEELDDRFALAFWAFFHNISTYIRVTGAFVVRAYVSSCQSRSRNLFALGGRLANNRPIRGRIVK